MSKHKNCPFCGGEPEPHSYISTKNFILCTLCRNGTAMYEKMSDAWAAWDRRDDAAVKALVEVAKAIHAHTKNNHQICGLNWALEKAIKKVEGL